METTVLIFLLVVVSILLIGIILIQSGKGDLGSAMGGNTMNQAFGSQGADKLLVRVTTGLAVIFMALAIFIQREQVSAAQPGGSSNEPGWDSSDGGKEKEKEKVKDVDVPKPKEQEES